MDLQPELIARAVSARRLELGEPIYYRRVTSSTNDDALALLKEGARTGSLFLADEQERGRGRQGNLWWSRAQASLTCSLLLRPKRKAEELPALTLVVGLALFRALCEALGEASTLLIKWPNDILLRGKKLAGVLVESHTDPLYPSVETDAAPRAIVVGIGVNVNGELPEQHVAKATSLELATGRKHSRESLVVGILSELSRLLPEFEAQGLTGLQSELNRHDALRDKLLRVGMLVGRGAGIDGAGHLLIETSLGLSTISAGTVEVIDSTHSIESL